MWSKLFILTFNYMFIVFLVSLTKSLGLCLEKAMVMDCEYNECGLSIVYLRNFGIGFFHCQNQGYHDWCYVSIEYSA